jgi:hypothetical protein
MALKITEQDIIDLNLLPIDILKQIPYSIRSKKDKYNINNLPKYIQYLIKEYKTNLKEVEYTNLLDANLNISKYGDFTNIDNYFDLVVEYLKNYLLLVKGQYPFDPLFYSNLKYYIQTKDTSLQYTLVSNEINRIIGILSTDLNISIKVKSLNINKPNVATNDSVTYNINLDIEVENNVVKKLYLEMV